MCLNTLESKRGKGVRESAGPAHFAAEGDKNRVLISWYNAQGQDLSSSVTVTASNIQRPNFGQITKLEFKNVSKQGQDSQIIRKPCWTAAMSGT